MRARARRWGNSLAVRIPKGIAEQAGVTENAEVDIDVIDSVIRVKPLQNVPTLTDLVERINSDNVHDEQDFGPARGREAW